MKSSADPRNSADFPEFFVILEFSAIQWSNLKSLGGGGACLFTRWRRQREKSSLTRLAPVCFKNSYQSVIYTKVTKADEMKLS